MHRIAPVIADLIRNPEGWGNDATHRHSGLDPESTGGDANMTAAGPSFPAEAGIHPMMRSIIPSPLTGEESKVRVKTMHQPRHSGLDPESRAAVPRISLSTGSKTSCTSTSNSFGL